MTTILIATSEGKHVYVDAFNFFILKCEVLDVQYGDGEFYPKHRSLIEPIEFLEDE